MLLNQVEEIRRIEKDIDRRIEKNSIPETLYHYTSLEAVFSIIQDKTLLFGSAKSMNDKNEIVHFLNQLEEALKENLDAPSQQKCTRFFESAYERLKKEYPYIFSMTRLEDDASQWERYADNAKGVRIGFNTRKLMLAFYNPNLILNEVFYRSDVREHVLYKKLKKLFESKESADNDINKGVIDEVLVCGYIKKHWSFESENEYRIATLWSHIPVNGSKTFMCRNEQIKQYIEFDLEKMCNDKGIEFKDLFENILIGPRSKQQLVDLIDFFEKQGMKKLSESISNSECPLR